MSNEIKTTRGGGVDTARILVTLQCNLRCGYCCNKLPRVKDRFLYIEDCVVPQLARLYPNICITGGEPCLAPQRVLRVLEAGELAGNKVYLYTNALEIKRLLKHIPDLRRFAGINVGLHQKRHVPAVLKKVREWSDIVRLQVRRGSDIPWRRIANEGWNVKLWTLNQCEMPNEEWYVWGERDE